MWVPLSKFGESTSKFDILKNGCQRVVVADGDWIELVVVTAGTADRDTKGRGTDSLDNFIEAVGASLTTGGRLLPDGGDWDMRA